MSKRNFLSLITLVGVTLAASVFASAQESTPEVRTDYAPVNGLQMYYEIRGTGQPLVVLHGAYMNLDMMGELVTSLVATRQVIAVELQGHGRTADIVDRPITFEQMADDVAALIEYLELENVDIFGYSMGGSTALQVAIRHPELVRKLIITSATYNSEGWYPELHAMISSMSPEFFIGTPVETEYTRLAPNPENFTLLVEKLIALDTAPQNWSAESIQGIESPALIIVGDSDQVRPEHAVDMFRLFDGGVPADLVGLPNSQLAVIPGATHLSVLSRINLLTPMINDFLDAAIPVEG
jgi:pimeloyl-ACP methyl ester carboxylesterase